MDKRTITVKNISVIHDIILDKNYLIIKKKIKSLIYISLFSMMAILKTKVKLEEE